MATNCSGNGEGCVVNNNNTSSDCTLNGFPIQVSSEENDADTTQGNTETGPIIVENETCTDGHGISGSSEGITSTVSEPKKGLSCKTGNIIEDLEKELFPLETSSKRRKEKFKQYKCEEFDFSVSTKKQTGFTTSRPVRWSLSLEKYFSSLDIPCSWHYKTNQKTKKYSETIINIEYDGKPVNIHIFYYTGVVLVSGEHRKWIENEFSKIQAIFEDEKQPDLGEAVDLNTQELDMLWAKYDELENAVNTHDDVIQKMMVRAQAAELKVVELEKGFDGKVTALTTLILGEFDTKVEKVKSDIDKKISSIHNKIDKFLNQTSDIPAEPDEINQLRTNITKMEDSIQQSVNSFINYGAIHQSDEKITQLDNNLQSLEAQIVALKNELLLEIKKTEEEVVRMSNNISALETQLSDLNEDVKKSAALPTRDDKSQSQSQSQSQPESLHNQRAEIMMCFDSNGKHIDRKKLWKVKSSIFKRCGTLYDVAQEVSRCKVSHLKYFMINVGCNDLDDKSNEQVFGEMELLIDQIREKFDGVKVIVGEITPRKDNRDSEVILFNNRLKEYAESTDHIFIIEHSNLRTPGWPLYADDKHIRSLKIGIYAANIIRTLKTAYNISSKSELFNSEPGRHAKFSASARNDGGGNFGTHNHRGELSQAPHVNRDHINHEAPVINPWEASYTGSSIQNRLYHMANHTHQKKNHPDDISDIKHKLLTNLQDAIQKVFE